MSRDPSLFTLQFISKWRNIVLIPLKIRSGCGNKWMIDRFCGIYSSPLKARIPLICERSACAFATICFLGNPFHTFCMEISYGSPYGLCVIRILQNIVYNLCKTLNHLLCEYCGCGDSRCFFREKSLSHCVQGKRTEDPSLCDFSLCIFSWAAKFDLSLNLLSQWKQSKGFFVTQIMSF